jgi:hypothetical protein
MSAPAELRNAVARDLAPTRPLAPPSIRALAIVPIAAAIVAAVPLLNFFRPDLASAGVLRVWGLSIAQAIAGIAMIAAALRESVPGRQLSPTTVASLVVGGLALPAILPGLAARAFDVAPGSHGAIAIGVACFRTSATAAVPAVMAAAILSARAMPLRPLVAGAIYGLGCGLIADGALRLWCEFSAPEHVLLAHTTAVVASMMLGVIAATVSRR